MLSTIPALVPPLHWACTPYCALNTATAHSQATRSILWLIVRKLLSRIAFTFVFNTRLVIQY